MNIIYKVYFTLLFLVILGIILLCCLPLSRKEEMNHNIIMLQKVADSLQYENYKLILKNDSLLKFNEKLIENSEIIQKSIQNKEKELIALKARKNEKIDKIVHLPVDEAILFFIKNTETWKTQQD